MKNYSLRGYGAMLADAGRVAVFRQAIAAAVRPGDVVLELGTGPGVMAMWAAQAGARHVHAVDPNDAILLARQCAQASGLGGRITFHQTISSRLALSERATVLIEDLRGSLPTFGTRFADLMDARARLLTPDARWICQRDRLFVAVAESAGETARVHEPWQDGRFGVDLAAIRNAVPHRLGKHRCTREELFTAPACWAELDYAGLTTPHVRGTAELTVERTGVAHGLALWFDAQFFGGLHISNAPGEPRHTYGGAFLPWPQPTRLQTGDRVQLTLSAAFNGVDYDWDWHSLIRPSQMGISGLTFQQSTRQGQILNPLRLVRRSGSYRPSKTAGDIARFTLARMDGQTSNAQLAAALQTEFPQLYPTPAAALAKVVEIIEGLASGE